MTEIQGTLHQKIKALEAEGVNQFDPVRFTFIQSMARRAAGKTDSICEAIEHKALAALAEYRKDVDQSRTEAEDIVRLICSEFPDKTAAARALFNNHEFNQIIRLGRKLRHRCRPTGLLELKKQILKRTPGVNEKKRPVSVDDLLRQQELDIVASIDRLPTGRRAAKTGSRSLQRFKETMMKLHADRLVNRAVRDCPENAGPHNSQMIAITTLSTLRQISPDYLNRLVSHIDTLIWLKQASEDMDKNKTKKSRN